MSEVFEMLVNRVDERLFQKQLNKPKFHNCSNRRRFLFWELWRSIRKKRGQQQNLQADQMTKHSQPQLWNFPTREIQQNKSGRQQRRSHSLMRQIVLITLSSLTALKNMYYCSDCLLMLDRKELLLFMIDTADGVCLDNFDLTWLWSAVCEKSCFKNFYSVNGYLVSVVKPHVAAQRNFVLWAFNNEDVVSGSWSEKLVFNGVNLNFRYR